MHQAICHINVLGSDRQAFAGAHAGEKFESKVVLDLRVEGPCHSLQDRITLIVVERVGLRRLMAGSLKSFEWARLQNPIANCQIQGVAQHRDGVVCRLPCAVRCVCECAEDVGVDKGRNWPAAQLCNPPIDDEAVGSLCRCRQTALEPKP